MKRTMESSKSAWHSAMGGDAIKKISIYEGSLHKDAVKDSFWAVTAVHIATLVGLWLFWQKDPCRIRLTDWYLTDFRSVASITCCTGVFLVLMCVSIIALRLRESVWGLENIAEALSDSRISHAYYDLWLWIPCHALVFINLAVKSGWMLDFWVWFSGEILYLIIIWFWAFNNYFKDDLDFRHVFIDTDKLYMPSAGTAVPARDGLLIEFEDEDIPLDLRKCKITVYGKGILLIKWYDPRVLYYLEPADYVCLKVRHFNGDLTVYRFEGDTWEKDEILSLQ